MGTTTLVFFTGILSYAVETVLVGIAFGVLAHRMRSRLSFPAMGVLLFLSFVLLRIYTYPAAAALQATITVHNESAARLLGAVPNMPLEDLVRFGLFEIVVCLIQTFLATPMARMVREICRA